MAHRRCGDACARPAERSARQRVVVSDEALRLVPPREMNLDRAIEWADADELVEITPAAIRVRKRILPGNMRPKSRQTK